MGRAQAGTSGLGPVTLFDPARIACEVAAEVKGFDAEERFGRREARKMDRVTALSLAAAREAWENAGAPAVDPSRGGVVFGTAVGGMQTVIEQAAILAERPDRLSPHFLPNFLVDTPTSYIATDLQLRGPNFAVVSACATGAHAIGVATEMLRRGEADVILAGGADCGVIEVLLAGFTVMKALGKPRPGEPVSTASRPFDVTRDGFVIGEGAVVLVLERLEDARRRGAEPIAEVVGYGASNDAFHIAAPHPEGIGVIEMMRAALDRAGLEPSQVSYVNAHGTSTPLNDPAETAAIHAVFGEHAAPPAGVVDEEHDRAPARRRRCARDRRLRAGAARRDHPADDQPARARPAVRPRLRVGGRAARRRSLLRALELDGPRRPQRLHVAQAARAVDASAAIAGAASNGAANATPTTPAATCTTVASTSDTTASPLRALSVTSTWSPRCSPVTAMPAPASATSRTRPCTVR